MASRLCVCMGVVCVVWCMHICGACDVCVVWCIHVCACMCAMGVHMYVVCVVCVWCVCMLCVCVYGVYDECVWYV